MSLLGKRQLSIILAFLLNESLSEAEHSISYYIYFAFLPILRKAQNR